MYFAVLQQGGDALKAPPQSAPWRTRLALAAKALPLSMGVRAYSAVLRRLGDVRAVGAAPPDAAVLVTWHKHLLIALSQRGPARDFLTLPASPRLDAIAEAAESLGFRVLREPFAKDGTPPAQLTEFIRDGNRALLSADGPHAGGILRAEALALAARSGAPLVALRIEVSRAVTLPGGMVAPVPGASVTLHFSEPIDARAASDGGAAALLAALGCPAGGDAEAVTRRG